MWTTSRESLTNDWSGLEISWVLLGGTFLSLKLAFSPYAEFDFVEEFKDGGI